MRLRKADKRRDELKTINDAADQFVKNWKEAETFGDDIIKLHQKFSDVFEASKPLLETVLDGFAHLRKGEKIQGHTTAKEWCLAVLGVSYERVRQLRTAKLSLAEPIVIISDNPQQDNQLPKSSAERRSVSARNAAETRKKNAEAKRGEENERPEDKAPSVPQFLANRETVLRHPRLAGRWFRDRGKGGSGAPHRLVGSVQHQAIQPYRKAPDRRGGHCEAAGRNDFRDHGCAGSNCFEG